MIVPQKLKKGDKVAIVSLSSGMGGDKEFIHKYRLGKKRLEDVFGLNVFETNITPSDRLEESVYSGLGLNEMHGFFMSEAERLYFCTETMRSEDGYESEMMFVYNPNLISDYEMYDNGVKIVSTIFVDTEVIDQDNYEMLADNGYFTEAELRIQLSPTPEPGASGTPAPTITPTPAPSSGATDSDTPREKPAKADPTPTQKPED